MPLQPLKFRPGVNRESTSLANEGGWFECDKIRFRSGFPEKVGGWTKDMGGTPSELQPPAGSFWGVARSLFNWVTLAGYNLLAIGTNLKFYIQNSYDGFFNDITPIRSVSAAGATTFAATPGSSTIIVTDPGYNGQTGNFVIFSGAVSLGGNINADVLNSEFQITYIDGSSYSINSPVVANASDVGDGGTAVVAEYQIYTGGETYSVGVGWGAGFWGGWLLGVPDTLLDGGLNETATTVNVTSTTGFGASGVLLIDSELISYSGKTSTSFTGCTRAYDQSTVSAHLSGAIVQEATNFTGWGEAAPVSAGIGQQLRLWSQANFGQHLILNPRGGALYFWAVDANPSIFNRAQELNDTNTNTQNGVEYWLTDSACPTVCNIVMVSDASRFVLAFGCNDYGSDTQDPLLIRWSDQEDYKTWQPSATNQAGSYRLSLGSGIVATQQSRQEILVWTDFALYSMQYLGPPYVWGVQMLADNVTIAGQNAIASANNVTYWMGTDKFYAYSGRVETLPCTLRQYVFGDINLSQRFQFFAGTNEGFNEIWWFYCSANSQTIDRYVIYNHLERVWYYGNLARTTWLDNNLRGHPMATGYNGQLIYHESGVDDGTTNPPSPINAYIQSADFDIGEGHNYGFAWRLIPDLTFDGSTGNQPQANFIMMPRKNPGANYSTADVTDVVSTQSYTVQKSYLVQQFTQIVYVRVRGRQMAFRVESNTLGTHWQLGVPKIDLRPDGQR